MLCNESCLQSVYRKIIELHWLLDCEATHKLKQPHLKCRLLIELRLTEHSQICMYNGGLINVAHLRTEADIRHPFDLDTAALQRAYKYELFSSLMHIKALGRMAMKPAFVNIHMEITVWSKRQQKRY